MKYRYSLAIALLMIVAGCKEQPQTFYSNPVIQAELADPSVIRVGDCYYAAGTSSEWAPFYPLYKSMDLVNWEQTGHIFNQMPDWTEGSFWAPELFQLGDKTLCYYTARRASDHKSCVAVAVADSPEGPYTDYGVIIDIGTEEIDGFVFNDEGHLYITWKAYGLDKRPNEILCSRLSDDGLSLVGEPFSLYVDEDRIGSEGQSMIKEGDWYYLIWAARGCCGANSDYEVRIARSRSVDGPYEAYPDNPVLKGQTDEVTSIGHGTPVRTPDGSIYYLSHAYLAGPAFQMSRVPFLSRMEQTSDGWLRFSSGKLASVKQESPLKGCEQHVRNAFVDDFSAPELDASWSWNFADTDVKARPSADGLLLSGVAINSDSHGAALCQRIFSPDYVMEVSASICQGQESGITFFGDAKNLVELVSDGSHVFLRQIVDGEANVLFEAECSSTLR